MERERASMEREVEKLKSGWAAAKRRVTALEYEVKVRREEIEELREMMKEMRKTRRGEEARRAAEGPDDIFILEEDVGIVVLLPGIDQEANVVPEVERVPGDADGLFIVGPRSGSDKITLEEFFRCEKGMFRERLPVRVRLLVAE